MIGRLVIFVVLTAVLLGVGMAVEEVQMDVVDIIDGNADLSTLSTAIRVAGLEDVMREKGPFTVFAPNDEAFSEGSVQMNDTKQLAMILMYHVVLERLTSEDLADGMTKMSLQGANVSFSVTDEGVTVDSAEVVEPDLMGSNGVVHVVNGVLMSEDLVGTGTGS